MPGCNVAYTQKRISATEKNKVRAAKRKREPEKGRNREELKVKSGRGISVLKDKMKE